MPAVAYDVAEEFAEKGTKEEEKPESPSKDDILYTPHVGLVSCMYAIHELQVFYVWHV